MTAFTALSSVVSLIQFFYCHLQKTQFSCSQSYSSPIPAWFPVVPALDVNSHYATHSSMGQTTAFYRTLYVSQQLRQTQAKYRDSAYHSATCPDSHGSRHQEAWKLQLLSHAVSLSSEFQWAKDTEL